MAEIVNTPKSENPIESQKYWKKHALNHLPKGDLYEYSSTISNIQSEYGIDVEKYITAGRGYWIKRFCGDKTLEQDLRLRESTADGYFCFKAKINEIKEGEPEVSIPFSVIEIASPFLGPMEPAEMETIYNRLRLYTARGIYPPVFMPMEEDAIYSSMEKWEQPCMLTGDVGAIVGVIKDAHVLWAIIMWDPTFIAEENPMEILYGSQSGFIQMTGMIPTAEIWKDSPKQGMWWDYGIPVYTYSSVAMIAAYTQRSERMRDLLDSMILTDQIVLSSYQNLLRTMRDEASRMEALQTARRVVEAVEKEQVEEEQATPRPNETPDSEVEFEDAFAARMLRCEEAVSDTYVGDSVADTIVANSFGEDANI